MSQTHAQVGQHSRIHPHSHISTHCKGNAQNQCLSCGKWPQVRTCQFTCVCTAAPCPGHSKTKGHHCSLLPHHTWGRDCSGAENWMEWDRAPHSRVSAAGLCHHGRLPSCTPLSPNSMQPFSELLPLPFSQRRNRREYGRQLGLCCPIVTGPRGPKVLSCGSPQLKGLTSDLRDPGHNR